MTVKGKVVLNEKGVQGAKVLLVKNGSKIDEALTNSGGKYVFTELEISPEGDTYIIKISKPGHITIKHWVSTKAPDDRKIIFPDYAPEVQLFKTVREVERVKALSAILDRPISKFSYSVSKGDFADDRAYFSTIKAQVNQLFAILEAEDRERKRLLDEYRAKQLAEKPAVEMITEKVKSPFEKEYDEALTKADKSFAKKKYRKAMTQYKSVMTIVSKSGLAKSERDKLKKPAKRKIYELETIMAGLSDEEIDKLGEVETEEVVKLEEEAEEDQSVAESAELEEADVELEEDVEKAEELSEGEIAKIEAERALPDAMEKREQMLEERMEEVIAKRKENVEVAAKKTMVSNAAVKQHEVAASIEKREAEVKKSRNKEVAALRNQAMITMIAYSTKSSGLEVKQATPTTSYEERPADKPVRILASTSAADKDKKNLERTVVIVHKRIKVADAKKKVTTGKRSVAKEESFKPRSIQYKEESMYKTITNTIIKYPIKQDTLQHVDYLWGASYYYMNEKEIGEAEYKKVLERLK